MTVAADSSDARLVRPPSIFSRILVGIDGSLVGSRGLHSFWALGSVSERLAHAAPSSVLIVRQPPLEPGGRPATTSALSDGDARA